MVVFPVAMLLIGLVEARRLPGCRSASGSGGGRELGVPRDEEVVETPGDGASRLILLGDEEGLLLPLDMLLLPAAPELAALGCL